MATQTNIEWTDSTWNPWAGCTKVSTGCKNCYAETLSRRNPAVLGIWGPRGTRVASKSWEKPKAWNRAAAKTGVRRKVFFSLGDWLEDRHDLLVPRANFLRLIQETPWLDWLLLTKRPENFESLLLELECETDTLLSQWIRNWRLGYPPANVWVGVSIEDQQTADWRLPWLQLIPAVVRFISAEPLLEPVDIKMALESPLRAPWWVIVGGESGPNARPCDCSWIHSLVTQCRVTDTRCFVKQLGSLCLDPGGIRKVVHPKGGDIADFPNYLCVREFPVVA